MRLTIAGLFSTLLVGNVLFYPTRFVETNNLEVWTIVNKKCLESSFGAANFCGRFLDY